MTENTPHRIYLKEAAEQDRIADQILRLFQKLDNSITKLEAHKLATEAAQASYGTQYKNNFKDLMGAYDDELVALETRLKTLAGR